MTKSSAELSQAFTAQADAFAELIKGLDDEQWQTTTEEEGWSVGTVAHHVATGLGSTWGFTDMMLAANIPDMTFDDINAMNAAHASEHPNPDKAETVAMFETSAAQVAEGIAALDESSLDHAAVVPAFSQDPLTVRGWIEMIVIGHIGMHLPSIEAATKK